MFSTIYDFLVSHKVLLKKARNVENVAETEDSMLLENSENGQHDDSWYELIKCTHTLDKTYHFFKDGHV